MSINADNNTFKNNNSTRPPLENIKDKNSEENLVKDLKDSLSESVDESINILNSLMRMIQEKVKDDSVKEETKTLVNSLSENILNLVNKNVEEFDFKSKSEQSNLEEE